MHLEEKKALSNVRQDSDCDDFFAISKAEVLEQIESAEFFLSEIRKHLDTK